MEPAEGIRVEIAYPQGAAYRVVETTLPVGATARDALEACGVALAHEGTLGVFGRAVAEDTVLADGDRLELYLPLRADPKTARRRRAAAGAKKSGRP